ncbi:DH domain-containing protein [Entamoeba marina]
MSSAQQHRFDLIKKFIDSESINTQRLSLLLKHVIIPCENIVVVPQPIFSIIFDTFPKIINIHTKWLEGAKNIYGNIYYPTDGLEDERVERFNNNLIILPQIFEYYGLVIEHMDDILTTFHKLKKSEKKFKEVWNNVMKSGDDVEQIVLSPLNHIPKYKDFFNQFDSFAMSDLEKTHFDKVVKDIDVYEKNKNEMNKLVSYNHILKGVDKVLGSGLVVTGRELREEFDIYLYVEGKIKSLRMIIFNDIFLLLKAGGKEMKCEYGGFFSTTQMLRGDQEMVVKEKVLRSIDKKKWGDLQNVFPCSFVLEYDALKKT